MGIEHCGYRCHGCQSNEGTDRNDENVEFNLGCGRNYLLVLKMGMGAEEINGIGCCRVRGCKSFHSHSGFDGEHWRECA